MLKTARREPSRHHEHTGTHYHSQHTHHERRPTAVAPRAQHTQSVMTPTKERPLPTDNGDSHSSSGIHEYDDGSEEHDLETPDYELCQRRRPRPHLSGILNAAAATAATAATATTGDDRDEHRSGPSASPGLAWSGRVPRALLTHDCVIAPLEVLSLSSNPPCDDTPRESRLPPSEPSAPSPLAAARPSASAPESAKLSIKRKQLTPLSHSMNDLLEALLDSEEPERRCGRPLQDDGGYELPAPELECSDITQELSFLVKRVRVDDDDSPSPTLLAYIS